MEGVDILSVKDVQISHFYDKLAFIAFLIMLGIFVVTSIVYVIHNKKESNKYALALLIMVFGICISILTSVFVGTMFSFLEGYEKEYKVTIDESVSMVDFYEKYEIISVEGKIYTVRERNYDTN